MSFKAPFSWLVYWLLLIGMAAAGAGVGGAVVVPLLLAGLMAASLPKYAALWPRALAAGAVNAFVATIAASLAGSLLTALAAFWLGRLIRVVFW